MPLIVIVAAVASVVAAGLLIWALWRVDRR
jgi:hypothetical protein